MGLEIGADLQGISQDHRVTLGNQLLPGIGRAADGTTLVAILSLRAGVGVDLLVRQGASERLMTREALRSRQSDAFGAGAIASDRPTKCGVDHPGLKDALGVIYLSAAPSHNQRRRSASFGTLAPDCACWRPSPGPGETIHQRAFTKGNAA